jgi:hypothetical protein
MFDSVEYAACVIAHCREALPYVSRKEKFDKIYSMMKASFRGVSEKGYASYELRLIPEGDPVCTKAFLITYDFAQSTFSSLSEKVKQRFECIINDTAERRYYRYEFFSFLSCRDYVFALMSQHHCETGRSWDDATHL